MKKKNAFDYSILALFIMCMGLALCAALDYNTRATNREYLNQGIWLLSMVVITLVSFAAIRFSGKAAPGMKPVVKNVIWLGLCTVFFAVGLAARLWVINHIVLEPESDYETYYRIANELMNGTMLSPEAENDRRYIALYPHTIGFPMLFLVPAFRIFGAGVRTGLMVNLVFGMISVIVAGHIGYRIFGRIGSFLCTALLSLWPSYIFYSSMLATEPSFTMLILIAFDMMVCILDRRKGGYYEAAPWNVVSWLPLLGIVLALAGAIRPMAVILLAAFAVALLRTPRTVPQDLHHSGARDFLTHHWLCLIVIFVPYYLTNVAISGSIQSCIAERPVTGVTASGYNMMVGLNSQSEGLWNEVDADFFDQAYAETGSADQAHAACLQVAINRVQTEPENVMNLMVYKFRDLWRTDDFGLDWNLLWAGQQGTLTQELTGLIETVRPWGRGAYMAILLYSLIGALKMWNSRKRISTPLLICILFFLGTALSHMLLETQVRYHYNMIPFLIFLAVSGCMGWRLQNEIALPEEPAEETTPPEEKPEDHTDFDIASAVQDGNVIVSVSKAYERGQDGQPAMVGRVSVSDVRVVEEKTKAHQTSPEQQN